MSQQGTRQLRYGVTMPTRPCLTCGTLTTNPSRCTNCNSTHQANRNQRRTWYHGDWARRSSQARTAWVEANGRVCPGVGRPAHPATNLELDHTTGAVLCHQCNVDAGPADHTT